MMEADEEEDDESEESHQVDPEQDPERLRLLSIYGQYAFKQQWFANLKQVTDFVQGIKSTQIPEKKREIKA